MKDRKLLSICIPTYNRKWMLYKLLYLLKEINTEGYTIIVCDNASNDGTLELMKEFENDDNIIYLRNDSNLGYDLNFLRVIEEGISLSKYSLWIGDDDFPIKEFFDDIPNLLEKNDLDMVIVNSEDYHSGEVSMENDQDYIETDLIKILRDWSTYFIRWGQFILNNDILKVDFAKKYIGYHHVSLGLIVESLYWKESHNEEIRVCFTGRPYIITSCGTRSYSDRTEEILRGYAITHAMYPKDIRKDIYNIFYELISIRRKATRDIVWPPFISRLMEDGYAVQNIMPPLFEKMALEMDMLTKCKEKDFVIFGSGFYGKNCLAVFKAHLKWVKAIVDNDENKWGTNIDGIDIISPSELKSRHYNNIFIIVAMSSEKIPNVMKQLYSFGWKPGKDYMSWTRFLIELYRNNTGWTKSIFD